MKQNSAYSRLASVIVKLLIAALCLLFLLFYYYSSKNPIPFRNGDGLEITVFNSSCQRGSLGQALSVRLVEGSAAAQVLALCKSARPVRPLPDSVLMGGSVPYVCLTHESSRFILDFRDGNGQEALPGAGQDSPTVHLTSLKAKSDGWQMHRQWLCTLSAEDYANLYALADGYAVGPELTVAP